MYDFKIYKNIYNFNKLKSQINIDNIFNYKLKSEN